MPATKPGKLRCVVVTPEGQLADEEADFVVLAAHDGQFGILPQRSALLCRLDAGMLRIDQDRRRTFFFVAGGFAEVLDDDVTIVTNEAIAAADLDFNALSTELIEARNLPTKTPEEWQHREHTLRIVQGKCDTARTYARQSARSST